MSLFPTRLQLDVYSHAFTVSRFDETIYRLCTAFAMRYVERSFQMVGRHVRQEVKKVYATAYLDRTVWFFHRHQLDEFLEHLHANYLKPEEIRRVDHPLYTPDTAGFRWVDKTLVPKPFQREASLFFQKPEPIIKVQTAQAGSGKSIGTLLALHDINQRALLIMRPQYQKQWLRVAQQVLGVKKGEIVLINGIKSLKALLSYREEPSLLDPLKLIILSNKTYQMYLRSFLNNSGKDIHGFEVPPLAFYEALKVGVRVIDEVHLDFHLNFIIDCMSHVPKSISLSATLKGDNPLKNRIVNLMFPQASYAPAPVYNAYIRLYSIGYRVRENWRLKYLNLFRQYSQTMYEKSIMKHKTLWKAYVAMIVTVVRYQFVEHREYQPGMKCAVYCGMVEMCKAVQVALAGAFPSFKVPLFVGGADEAAMLEGDIIVTNLQMAGTGRDIPDLMVGICAIGLSNQQSNEQLVGRLREPKRFAGTPVRFIFLYNQENPKHQKYQDQRSRTLDDKMHSINELVSDLVI